MKKKKRKILVLKHLLLCRQLLWGKTHQEGRPAHIGNHSIISTSSEQKEEDDDDEDKDDMQRLQYAADFGLTTLELNLVCTNVRPPRVLESRESECCEAQTWEGQVGIGCRQKAIGGQEAPGS